MSADDRLRQFEWSDLKFFLELVRSGNPSAAGRRLKVDHTTVRRRVAALEAALKARLFSARGPTYELTPDGERLLKYAEAIEALTIRLEDEIVASDGALSGTVRVGAPDGFGAYFLGRHLPRLAQDHPDLRLKIVVLPQVVNLSNREADLAVALSPPNQLRQIIRKLTPFSMRIYASAAYLASADQIEAVTDLAGHRFVGYVPDQLYVPELDALPHVGDAIEAHIESTSIGAQIEATAAGAGLCVLPDFIAGFDPRLQVVLSDLFHLEREYWLVIHPEMINLARVRAVIDFLVECVRHESERFNGVTLARDAAAQ